MQDEAIGRANVQIGKSGVQYCLLLYPKADKEDVVVSNRRAGYGID